jgi:cell division protease FtsH
MQTKPAKKGPKKSSLSSFSYLIIGALIITAGLSFIGTSSFGAEEVSFTEFTEQIDNNQISESKLTVEDDKISYTLKDGQENFTYKETGVALAEILPEETLEKVNILVKPNSGFLSDLLLSIIPFILIAGFFIFMFRQAQGGNSQALSFGKSKAKLQDQTKKRVGFKDVAGAEESKEELVEVVDFLKNPQKYRAMGAKIPKGVLMIGAPGTGKTLLARAVAGEADVPFFTIAGSEFVEMFVGVGASRVRDLFKKAKTHAPCIIFIDEIDAVGRKRGAGLGGSHDEREQTLNQILIEMDGFENETNVIVIAATNRPDVLDSALLRPGRFDRRVRVDMPNIIEREQILEVHAKNKPLAKGIDFKTIARQTPGFAGADIENIMNEAAIIAARKNQKNITQNNIETAVEKVTIGLEKKSRKLSKQELKITSFHEVGHAVVGHLIEECDPVNKISIISRGSALGVTWFLPEKDSHLYAKSKFEGKLCSLLGGYCAEKVFFKEVTTGASNDLQQATGIARSMVMTYGMSELGPIMFGEKNQEVFLGKDIAHMKNYSETYAAKIDELIQKLLQEAHDRTLKLIEENKAIITEIANALLEKETLDKNEFLAFFNKK